jgi:hypothetical protein
MSSLPPLAVITSDKVSSTKGQSGRGVTAIAHTFREAKLQLLLLCAFLRAKRFRLILGSSGVSARKEVNAPPNQTVIRAAICNDEDTHTSINAPRWIRAHGCSGRMNQRLLVRMLQHWSQGHPGPRTGSTPPHAVV